MLNIIIEFSTSKYIGDRKLLNMIIEINEIKIKDFPLLLFLYPIHSVWDMPWSYLFLVECVMLVAGHAGATTVTNMLVNPLRQYCTSEFPLLFPANLLFLFGLLFTTPIKPPCLFFLLSSF